MLTRTQIINSLIIKHNYKSYLEIGVNTPSQPGYNWSSISCDLKHGVDPNVATTFKMTSDMFFEHNKQKYDFIFIDGLHLYEQVYKDTINALASLNEGGTIMLHDCNPTSQLHQRRDRQSDIWNGDCWRAVAHLRIERPDLKIYTIDTDEGCAIVRKGQSEPYDILKECRTPLLNLISPEEWKSQL